MGHSLGCVFILHVVEKFNVKLDSAIFVAPFMQKLNRLWQIDLANKTFWREKWDSAEIKKLIPVSYVVYSDNDPYVSPTYPETFAGLVGASKIVQLGGGHMNSEAGYLDFPLVFELCKTRLRRN